MFVTSFGVFQVRHVGFYYMRYVSKSGRPNWKTAIVFQWMVTLVILTYLASAAGYTGAQQAKEPSVSVMQHHRFLR